MARATMMIPTAAHQGRMASRISPRTTPAIPTLVLDLMMTPSIRTHRGVQPVSPAYLVTWENGCPELPSVGDEGRRVALPERTCSPSRDATRWAGAAGTGTPRTR